MRFIIPLAILCCLLAAVHPAKAEDKLPLEMVQDIYAHFLGPDPTGVHDFDLIRPIAAPELEELLERETQCQKSGDICRYGFSVIVDGQDFDLADFKLAETAPSPETTEIVASFTNFGHRSEVVYLFSLHEDRWILTDILSRGEYPWSLTELLSGE